MRDDDAKRDADLVRMREALREIEGLEKQLRDDAGCMTVRAVLLYARAVAARALVGVDGRT